jgi:hypothetical protein
VFITEHLQWRNDMTQDSQNLYLDDALMNRPNHERVERMLHEMEFLPRRDRRHDDLPHKLEQRVGKSFFDSLVAKLVQ